VFLGLILQDNSKVSDDATAEFVKQQNGRHCNRVSTRQATVIKFNSQYRETRKKRFSPWSCCNKTINVWRLISHDDIRSIIDQWEDGTKPEAKKTEVQILINCVDE
jgi:hypothetical protein